MIFSKSIMLTLLIFSFIVGMVSCYGYEQGYHQGYHQQGYQHQGYQQGYHQPGLQSSFPNYQRQPSHQANIQTNYQQPYIGPPAMGPTIGQVSQWYNHRQFGCTFKNPNYALPDSTQIYGNTPVFGTEPEYVWHFQDATSFKMAYDKIASTYANFLSQQVYNNVDVLLNIFNPCLDYQRFYGVKPTFKQCYDTYFGPTAANLQDSTGLAIRWMKHMADQGSIFNTGGYLAAAYWKSLTTKAKPGYPNHVAAFVKIQINNDPNQIGYLVFDPGFALDKPVLVMDNNHQILYNLQLNKATTNADALGTMVFTKKGSTIGGDFTQNRDRVTDYMVYKVEQPYCSFMNTTVKPNVLNPDLMIVRRNHLGNVLAMLKTELRLQRKKSKSPVPTINLFYYNNQGGAKVKTLGIPVNDVSVLNDMRYAEIINGASYLFGMSSEVLKTKIRQLVAIFNDEDLLKQMLDMKY